jgi:outer membrane biosynthesis protein TonB
MKRLGAVLLVACLTALAAGCQRKANPDEAESYDPAVDGQPSALAAEADPRLLQDQAKIAEQARKAMVAVEPNVAAPAAPAETPATAPATQPTEAPPTPPATQPTETPTTPPTPPATQPAEPPKEASPAEAPKKEEKPAGPVL